MLPKRLPDIDFTGFKWGNDDEVGYYHCGRLRAELNTCQAAPDELASWLEAAVRGAEQGMSATLRWIQAQPRRPALPSYLVLLEASIYHDRSDALAYRNGVGWVQEGEGTRYELSEATRLQADLMPNKTRLEEVW